MPWDLCLTKMFLNFDRRGWTSASSWSCGWSAASFWSPIPSLSQWLLLRPQLLFPDHKVTYIAIKFLRQNKASKQQNQNAITSGFWRWHWQKLVPWDLSVEKVFLIDDTRGGTWTASSWSCWWSWAVHFGLLSLP